MLFDRSSDTVQLTEDNEPQLHVQWSSRAGTFFTNLRDTILPTHEEHTELEFEPATDFWQSVFVKNPSRLRFIFDSYASHVLFVLIVYGLSTSPLFQRRPQQVRDPFANTHIEYYPVSQYLPPVAQAPRPQRHALEGQPALAKQEIISVPPEPDNSRQTIVTPNTQLIKKDVPLPNVVAWAETAAPIQPLSASTRMPNPKLLVPSDVIAPAPEELPNSTRNLAQTPEVIKPTADLPADAKARLPSQLTPSVIEPPPTPDALRRRTGDINLAKLTPEVFAPKLPVPEQRSTGTPGGDSAATAAVAGVPSPQTLGAAASKGRMLALSVQPSDVKGPIEVPQGSRKGVFAAGPDGKEGAPGTPTIPGGGTAEHGSGGKDSGATNKDPLQGIYVGPAPTPKAPAPDPSLRNKLLNAMRNTGPSMPKPRVANEVAPEKASPIENKVFGSKRFYSMVLNMPNLTSSVGSWIVRYAELHPSQVQADLSAPVATSKVDPGYPAELIRDRVEGTVVLYAVIRANGTVDAIRVLDSNDERLNSVAMQALSRWHFRPGTKQGEAIDIEAVVQVPFRISKWKQ